MVFDSVGRDVMEKRGAMLRRIVRRHTRGARSNQIGMFFEQAGEGHGIAANNGFDGGLENRNG